MLGFCEIMKKLSAVVLVAVLIAPLVAVLCHCCIETPGPSSQVFIQSRECGCCSSQELKREQGAFGTFQNVVANLIQNFFSRISPAGSTRVILESANRNLAPGVLGPPEFFSPTPLYLSLEVLRI